MFVVLVPVVVKSDDYEELCHINEAGFVAVISLQCAADFMTFMALDHEQKFRSSGWILSFYVCRAQAHSQNFLGGLPMPQ